MEVEAPPPADIREAIHELHARFLNLPRGEIPTVERIFFQIQQAHWYYEDEWADVLFDQGLPHMRFDEFSKRMFATSPMLKEYCDLHADFKARFKEYASGIPKYGCVLVNPSCTHCLLVANLGAKSYSFPKGKVNQGEAGIDCAAREAYEETGYNPRHLLTESASVAQGEDGGFLKLYIAVGVPDDGSVQFAPIAKKEIGGISWVELSTMDSYQGRKPIEGGGWEKVRVYRVAEYLPQIRSILAKLGTKAGKKKGGNKQQQQQQQQQQQLLQQQQQANAVLMTGAGAGGGMNYTSQAVVGAGVSVNAGSGSTFDYYGNSTSAVSATTTSSSRAALLVPSSAATSTSTSTTVNTILKKGSISSAATNKRLLTANAASLTSSSSFNNNLLTAPLEGGGSGNKKTPKSWSVNDMFKANAQILGVKFVYDGNPHTFGDDVMNALPTATTTQTAVAAAAAAEQQEARGSKGAVDGAGATTTTSSSKQSSQKQSASRKEKKNKPIATDASGSTPTDEGPAVHTQHLRGYNGGAGSTTDAGSSGTEDDQGRSSSRALLQQQRYSRYSSSSPGKVPPLDAYSMPILVREPFRIDKAAVLAALQL